MLIEQYICLQLMRKNKIQRAKLCIRIYMQYSHSSGKQKNTIKKLEMPVLIWDSLGLTRVWKRSQAVIRVSDF